MRCRTERPHTWKGLYCLAWVVVLASPPQARRAARFIDEAEIHECVTARALRSAPGESIWMHGLTVVFQMAVVCAVEQAHAIQSAQYTLEKLERRFSLRVSIGRTYFVNEVMERQYSGEAPHVSQVVRYVPLLDQELAKYPPEAIRRARVRHIVLCAALRVDGQWHGAATDCLRTLYLDVSGHPTRLELHHELFHAIDWKYKRGTSYVGEWADLNVDGFAYGNGGRNARDPKLSMRVEASGFVTGYAMSAIEEDRAEVFALMMVNMAYVDKRCTRDSVVEAKVKLIKRIVAEWCAAMGSDHWERVRECQGSDGHEGGGRLGLL